MAITVSAYNNFFHLLGNGDAAFDTDTFKIILLNSSHTFTATHTDLTDISANELSTANGYTAGGAALSSVTFTQSSGVATFDAADVTWTASGGDIGPANFAVIYDDTVASDKLLLQIAFGGALTAGDGTNFKIVWHANGIFRIRVAD